MYGSMSSSSTRATPLLPETSAERQQARSERRKLVQKRWKDAATKATVMGRLFPQPPTKPPTRPQTRYSYLYSLFNPHSNEPQAAAFKSFITAVILFDLVAFVIRTDEPIGTRYDRLFYILEGITSSVFLVEYILRLAVITERPKYARPILGRLVYACKPAMVLDLLATAPFFLEALTGYELPTLTFLRIFRLFRILKTEGYMKAMDAVYRVVYYNRAILYVAALVCTFLVLSTAFLLYFLRPPDDHEQFDSLASTLYLSTLMLTGQGGPNDADHLPWYTKAVVLLTAVFSVAMFAIPASMLTWGFEAEAERLAKRTRRKFLEQKSSERSSSTDGIVDTTDEEYFRIIAGEEEEDEEEWQREQRSKFDQADGDRDGTLTVAEFLALQQADKDSATPKGDVKLVQRLEALEERMDETNRKLDRILQLLQE